MQLHIFEEAAEGILGEAVVFFLAVPDVERGLNYALAYAGRDFPRILEFFEFLQCQGVNVLAVLVVRRVDYYAANGRGNVS